MQNFIKYLSIGSALKKADINKVIDAGLSENQYIAFEKIHGSNFSFWCTGGKLHTAMKVRTGKRSGFDDEFANADMLLKKYGETVKSIKSAMMYFKDCTEEDTVVVFGEVFGGSYHGEKKPNATTVQKGMHYHPDTEFMAFDIGVIKPGSEEIKYLSGKGFLDALSFSLITHCPIIAKGALEEVLKTPNEFPTRVPARFGLALPEGIDKHCTAEGYVVRGFDEDYYLGSNRVIFKSKNDKFAEEGKGLPRLKSAPVEIPEEHLEALNKLLGMINQSRLESVFSKEYTADQLSWSMIGELSGKMVKDILEDFEKDNEITFEEFYKPIKKTLHTASLDCVRNYFKEIL